MTGLARPGNRRGFTLIEILSVVAILALMASFVIPNLGAYQTRALRAAAEDLGTQLEFARQRAIMTGVPHRVHIDLEAVSYRIEWLAEERDPETGDVAEARPAAFDVDELDLRSGTPLPLEAPPPTEKTFQPVPGNFGRTVVLQEPFLFAGLETPQGYVTRGESSVIFERDGTASYTEIYIEDGDGRVVAIDVFPLEERVRIRRDDV